MVVADLIAAALMLSAYWVIRQAAKGIDRSAAERARKEMEREHKPQ